MASSDTELAEQLMEAGNALLDPPSSVDELLPLLDQVENCLAKVEQSPKPSMQTALTPSQKALITEPLFRHSDVDVKAAVAACISEITRITAPEAPYDDDKMKEVFQLIVSSFENLFDKSSRSYAKRTSILETVAKVRSCVVMLDLECDALIVEMFQHFLKTIRDDHPESVFVCMETIMTLVLEESEDITPELLAPLLESVKRDNEEVLPVSRKLAERVIESCGAKLKPSLTDAISKLGSSVADYGTLVSSICQESSDVASDVEQKDVTSNEPVVDNGVTAEEALDEKAQAEDAKPAEEVVDDQVQADDAKPADEVVDEEVKADDDKPAEEALDEKVQENEEAPGEVVSAEQSDILNEKSPKAAVSNGIPQPKEDETPISLEKQDGGQLADQPKDTDTTIAAEPDNMDTEKLANADLQAEEITEKRGETSSPSKLTEPSEVPHEEKEDEAMPDQKIDDNDASGAAEEKKPVDAAMSPENKTEAVSQPSSPKAVDPETADVASPPATENVPDESIPKKKGRTKKKQSLAKVAAPSVADVPKKTSEETSDTEPKPSKRSGKKVLAGNSNGEKTKKESGTASDSEAKTVKQAVKKVDANSDSEAKPVKKAVKKVDANSDSEAKPVKQAVKKVDANSDSEAKPVKQAVKKVDANSDSEAKPVKQAAKKADANSDSEAKPVKQAAKKVDANSKSAGESSSKKQDKKKQSGGKGVSKKEETKTPAKNVSKEKVVSLNSLKPNKDESDVEETPKTSAKRKLASGNEKGSGVKEYGDNLVKSKVKVWWPDDQAFYEGIIESFDPKTKKHKVSYFDGDVETLNLKKEKWEFLVSDSEEDKEEAREASPDSSSDLPPKKKTKTTETSTKSASKMDISPKTGGGSSSKSKAAATKSGKSGKSKEDEKVSSKSAGKSKTEDIKTPKSSSGKPKEESLAKLKQEASKSKQKTPEPSSTAAKGKPTKSDGKSNGTGKSSSSKAKESQTASKSAAAAASGSKSSGKKRRR